MTTDFRALCAELATDIEEWMVGTDHRPMSSVELVDRTRTALAQSEPVMPTDEELYELWNAEGIEADFQDCRRYARAVLARWGTPAIEPVPVNERLPEVGDWVWHCYVGVRFWKHGRYNGRQFFIGDGPESQPATHWLPASALPTPEAP
jgi:hypothetical protein